MLAINRLEIRDFRGIRSLDLDFDGRSVALLGPNGAGKSSVVDAVDFLLTGQIRRLTGDGAGDLSLASHGPHIDGKPETAVVRATFRDSAGRLIEAERVIADPTHLRVKGNFPPELAHLVALASGTGHHLLTRRELLRYVFTEPGSRNKQVYALLQLTRIDTIRKELQGAAKQVADDAATQQGLIRQAEQQAFRSFEQPAADWTAVLEMTNERRGSLGAQPIESLDDPRGPRHGLKPPVEAGAHPLQGRRAKELLAEASAWCEAGSQQFRMEALAYRDAVAALRADVGTIKAMRADDLVAKGMALLTGDECPLCLKEWPRAELQRFLLDRQRAGVAARELLEHQREGARGLRSALAQIAGVAGELATLLRDTPGVAIARLDELTRSAGRGATTLAPDPLEGDVANAEAFEAALRVVTHEDLRTEIVALQEMAASLPDLQGLQKAWDELGASGIATRNHRAAVAQSGVLVRAAKDLRTSEAAFIRARDEVLEATYGLIAGRLSELYQAIHGNNEAGFQTKLAPTKAGLKMEVDFHDRGPYPPCALHSEGHQDSLGLCFFLALADQLSGGEMPIIILDDVMMSIDHQHRRGTAAVLKQHFPHCQFIITTHDRVWWRQLRTVGLVSGSSSFAFEDWTLAEGPVLPMTASSLLGAASAALERNDVPGAAHALRRAIEEHFPDICDLLGGTVRYRADGAYEAGDFISAVMARYGKLVGMARASAQSWGDESPEWAEIDAKRTATFDNYNKEQWAVNPSVHYNEWTTTLSPQDFRPVLEAYQALFNLLHCAACGFPFRVIEERKEPTAFRCNCGKTNWNLQAKPKSRG